MPIKTAPLARFRRDESGAIAVIVSLLLTVLLGFVALGVDVAALYRDGAQLQSVSDLAAISAMAEPDDAPARATAIMDQNARSEAKVTRLQPGRYLRNPAIPAADRFTALSGDDPSINAVALSLRDEAPLHFAQIFAGQSEVAINRHAMASRTGAASFALDSHIASLDGTVLAEALSQRFNVSLDLSLGETLLLADTSVNIGDLLAAVGDLTGFDQRNPAEILNAEMGQLDLAQALHSLLPAPAATALQPLLSSTNSARIDVSSLIGGIDTELGLTATDFLAEVEVSALDLLRATVAVEASAQTLSPQAALGVPGVAEVTAQLAIGAPPAQSGWVALGETGTQLSHAAARLHADIALAPDLLGSLGVGVSVTDLRVPIYLELAGASATLDALSCRTTSGGDTVAQFLTAQTPLHPSNGTSVAALYLGDLPADVFTDGPIDPAALDYVDILDLNLVIDLPLLPDLVINGITVQARAAVTVGRSQAEVIRFSQAEVASGDTTKEFGSEQLLSTAISGLLQPENTHIRVKPGQEGLVSVLARPVLDLALALLPERLLSTLAAPFDGVLDAVIASAGLRVGAGELTLTGHHCELIRLAN